MVERAQQRRPGLPTITVAAADARTADQTRSQYWCSRADAVACDNARRLRNATDRTPCAWNITEHEAAVGDTAAGNAARRHRAGWSAAVLARGQVGHRAVCGVPSERVAVGPGYPGRCPGMRNCKRQRSEGTRYRDGQGLALKTPVRFRRVAQKSIGERRACLRPWMAEFAPADGFRATQGTPRLRGAELPGCPFFCPLLFGQAKKSGSLPRRGAKASDFVVDSGVAGDR